MISMAGNQQEWIHTFMNITGLSEDIALQKFQEHGGDLSEAVNAHFNGERITSYPTSSPRNQTNSMLVDEDFEREPVIPLSSESQNSSHLPVLDQNLSSFNGLGWSFITDAPQHSYPREMRDTPAEFKIENSESRPSVTTSEDVTDSAHLHKQENQGNVIIVDEDDDLVSGSDTLPANQNDRRDKFTADFHPPEPSAPQIFNIADDDNDIEEQMIRAAIEASKREVEQEVIHNGFQTAEGQHAALHSLGEETKPSEFPRGFQSSILEEQYRPAEGHSQGFTSSELRQRNPLKFEGIAPFLDNNEEEDVEELPLIRQRSKKFSPASSSSHSIREVESKIERPSSPGVQGINNHPQQNGDFFRSEEWGGMSSIERDEAVMLEAAMFGGIPEHSTYDLSFRLNQTHQTSLDRNTNAYSWEVPRALSPTLAAQRILREQQDDEYLAALQADREKEIKALQEAEMRLLEEEMARESELKKERQLEEERRRKLLEEEEIERQLAAKQASLPEEPSSDDESAVTLLVRMPDGSRHGRRFLKTNKLQVLFDFIDVGKVVKPGTYKLVRPFPRRAFGGGESNISLDELGLTSKQEVLFLEMT